MEYKQQYFYFQYCSSNSSRIQVKEHETECKLPHLFQVNLLLELFLNPQTEILKHHAIILNCN